MTLIGLELLEISLPCLVLQTALYQKQRAPDYGRVMASEGGCYKAKYRLQWSIMPSVARFVPGAEYQAPKTRLSALI